MLPLLWYIGIPLAVSGVIAAVAAWFLRDTNRRKAWGIRLLTSCAVCMFLFVALHVVLSLFTDADGAPLSPAIVGMIAVCMIAAGAVPKDDPLQQAKPRLCRFFKRIGIAAVAVLLTETVLCNLYSFDTSPCENELPLTSFTTEATVTDHAVVLQDKATMTLTADITGADVIGLHFSPTDDAVRLKVSIKDDNFSAASTQVIERNIATGTGSAYVRILPYGTLHELTLELTDISQPLRLNAVTVGNTIPFEASVARVAAILLVAVLVIAVLTFRWYGIVYDPRRICHKLVIALCCLLCIGMCVVMIVPFFPLKDSEIPYPFENSVNVYDAPCQQFDAFQKGQLHLDITPSEELLALENPYDNSARDGVYYLWDRAFYNGKYYSYFGVAPIFLFYYPYYLITGSLPAIGLASGFFAILAVIFLFLAALKLVRLFCGRVNLLLLCLGLVTTVAASGIYWDHALASQYNLPLVCGICCLLMTLWTGLCGCTAKSRLWQIVALVLCGAGVCLTVASRPTLVTSALCLAPAFIALLLRKDYTVSRKITCAAAFLVPTAVGAAAIMLFNAQRFGSPFDFGATYQLTVSNIHANTLSLSLLPAAIYHYFLQPASVSGQFPFLRPSYSVLQNYGRYLYAETGLGALAFPHVAAATAGLPAVIRRAKRSPVKCAMLIMVPILALVTAFCGFCMGGVTLRYMGDILPLLALFALPVLLELHRRLSKNTRIRHHLTAAFAALFVATLILAFCTTIFCANDGILGKYAPQWIPRLETLVVFWR